MEINIDNSMRTSFDACPMQYYLRYKLNLVPKEVKSNHIGRLFGICVHEALAVWRRGGSQADVMKKFGEAWLEHLSTVSPEEKSIEEGYTVLKSYMKRYEEDYLVTDKVEFVEVGFTIHINEWLSYSGRIDWLPLWNEKRIVTDYKTSKYAGSSYTVPKPNNQMTGYIWAARELLGLDVNTAMLDIIGTTIRQYKYVDGKRKQLGPEDEKVELLREPTERTEEDFFEFKKGLEISAARLIDCEETGDWPKFTHSCPSFGGCDYIPICKSPKESMPFLIEGLYREEVWKFYE